MFDIGFSELVVIGIVGLIVIGPERLPKVARTVSHIFWRAQRYINDIRVELAREAQFQELKEMKEETTKTLRSVEHAVKREASEIKNETATALPKADDLNKPQA